MTPITEDILTAILGIHRAIIKLYCYVFGHKWGEWQDYIGHSPTGLIRECDRCGCFAHDSQGLKSCCRKYRGEDKGQKEIN